MKVLKGYVRNRNCPEGCIAECYIAEEAVEFCSEYLSGVETIGIPAVRNNTTNNAASLNLITKGRPILGGTLVDVDNAMWSQAHFYVLQNTAEVEPYIE